MTEIEEEATLHIRDAEVSVAQARKALGEAEARLRVTRRAYAKVRPLTEDERELLAKRVERGAPLCCTEGRAWLRGRFPPLWADALSAWAYDALGCSERRTARLREYADKVRRLKLDELPPGTEET